MSAQLQSIAPQSNGFALWHYVMDEVRELPINYAIDLNDERLYLFSQTADRLSFLTSSLKSAPPTLELPLKPLKNYQAWYFLEDFYKQNDLNSDVLSTKLTLCCLVSGNALAQAFRLAQLLKSQFHLIMILESTNHFPFPIKPAKFMLKSWPNTAASAIGASSLLEDWGIPNRLCSSQGLPGCFDGTLTELLAEWQVPQNWHLIRL